MEVQSNCKAKIALKLTCSKSHLATSLELRVSRSAPAKPLIQLHLRIYFCVYFSYIG